MSVDVRALLLAGQEVLDKAHDDQEVLKRGNLRGGSAGVVGIDGRIYGECHRLALSRLSGVEKEHEANRSIMFAAGRAAEDSWAEVLTAAGVQFKREDEIGIAWPIPGTDRIVTGRPDIVIGQLAVQYFRSVDGIQEGTTSEWVPIHGLELKGIYSAGSAVRVEVEGTPDAKHLAQAGFYSMALGVPYTLCYTNPSVIDVPYWAQKKMGAPKKLQPFYRLFAMEWRDNDRLYYRDERKDEWVETQYTKDGIAQYYALVVDLEQRRELGPRPAGAYADGTTMPFDPCAYCPMAAKCARYDEDHDFEAWVQS